MRRSGKRSRNQPSDKAQKLSHLQRELAWTHFGFILEEKLGELLEPEAILQEFSAQLKVRLPYDYLEVVIRRNSSLDDIEPLSWVRNDTGYGGKLLTIILTEDFFRGLHRRRNPLILQAGNASAVVENPDLLRIMNLESGILIPLNQGRGSRGVLALYFQRGTHFTSELRNWLKICGSILYRALKRAAQYQKAQKMATIDGLTGLYNHRYFMDQFSKEFTRARRYRNWLSLIIVDVDFFKHYNDNNGHLAGDRALKKIAAAIRSCVREIDLVARWGGEEFALLLPEINVENGMIVAEKIRREIEALRFNNERKQPNGNLTVSLGVAQNSQHLKNHREMFNLADIALYRAKQEGRNRCAFAK